LISAELLQLALKTPEYMQFGMTCMMLSHRINRTRNDFQSKELVEKFYLYWGLAVRSLNEHINMEDSRMSDMIIAGILTLMLVAVSI
jgi:hypothetical protein